MDWSHFEKIESFLPQSFSLLSWEGFWKCNLTLSFIIVFRYFLMVIPFHYLIFKNSKDASNHLHDHKLKPGQIGFEIKHSIISTAIFSLSGYAMGVAWEQGWSKIYLAFDSYPIWYLPLSFVVYSLVHEVYFYFTHVWMHNPSLYKKVHAVHHYSRNTTPWASFSFHPYETLVHAAFLPAMILLIPIHPVVVIAYLTFMTLTAISNHLGTELIPFKFIKRHFISGSHHNFHHQKFNCNYGLYYCFMDRLMGTEQAIDEKTFINHLKTVETKT